MESTEKSKWHISQGSTYPVIFFLVLLSMNCLGQERQNIMPPERERLYHFNLPGLFFKTPQAFTDSLKSFATAMKRLDKMLSAKNNKENLASNTEMLSKLEYRFRQFDLYLFLQFAINTNNIRAAEQEDSLYNEMVKRRMVFRERIRTMLPDTFNQALRLPMLRPYKFYLTTLQHQGVHSLTPMQTRMLDQFKYLLDDSYYSEILDKAVFKPVFTGTDSLDLFRDMGTWKNHRDSSVRKQGEENLAAGYHSVKNEVGFRYIQMIEGMNAFARARGYTGLIEETFDKLHIKKTAVTQILDTLANAAGISLQKQQGSEPDHHQFSIDSATTILKSAFASLGREYLNEASALLDPHNGRLDIIGGSNRLGMQGVASVYPIHTSVFFARNYEGYFMDLMVMAHEAGHAIQASLMAGNNVSILNSAGPGFFTESFGKFNELLVCYHLVLNASSDTEKQYYLARYHERLRGLFGSTSEADIEYRLIEGITNQQVKTPMDMDRITLATLAKYEDIQNSSAGELWLQMETNYKAPLHNVNDMLASLLALHYFRQFLEDRQKFSEQYVRFLKNGYDDSPSNLLQKLMNIDIESRGFCTEAIRIMQRELNNKY